MRAWRQEAPVYQLGKSSEPFANLIVEHRSPLSRPGTTYSRDLQLGKEANVALAASLIDGIVVPAGRVFSYHHAVGRPSRARGFRIGAELQDGALKPGLGGGCCQVTNLLYVLALLSGAEIVERHRHGFDLFPDSGRSVPFGCGATVFFPSRDLKFRNLLDRDLRIALSIEEGHLVGRMQSEQPIAARYEIFESESAIRRKGDAWVRENRVVRRALHDGQEPTTEEVAHNLAICLYDPTPAPEEALV